MSEETQAAVEAWRAREAGRFVARRADRDSSAYRGWALMFLPDELPGLPDNIREFTSVHIAVEAAIRADERTRYEALVEAGIALRPKIIAPLLAEWAAFTAALAALEGGSDAHC